MFSKLCWNQLLQNKLLCDDKISKQQKVKKYPALCFLKTIVLIFLFNTDLKHVRKLPQMLKLKLLTINKRTTKSWGQHKQLTLKSSHSKTFNSEKFYLLIRNRLQNVDKVAYFWFPNLYDRPLLLVSVLSRAET